MSITGSIIGTVVALALAGTFYYLKIFPKVTAVLALVGGSVLTGGLTGQLLQTGGAWLGQLCASSTAILIGTGVPLGVLSLIAVVVFVHDMWPKKKASTRTAVIGLLMPTLLAWMSGAAAGVGTGLVGALTSMISSLLDSIV